MRVLLIAPYCDGADVGEAWSTCQWVRALSTLHDVTVLTYQRPGATPVAALAPDARVVRWMDWAWPGRFERFNSMFKPGYVRFYIRARRWVRQALDAGERFDIAHQVSPLALRYPSPLMHFNLPYVIGPLAGSLHTPAAFRRECNRDPWFVHLRRADACRFAWDPLLRTTYAKAALVLGVAPYVRDLLSRVPIRRFEIMSETGLWSLPTMPSKPPARGGRVRLLFVGRLVRSKGARDAIRAMAHLQDLRAVTLDVVGDGPDRPACESEIKRLGLETRVRLLGHVPRAECDHFYRAADLFLFPSFREPSGNVVFEALSWGLPVVAAARGGPGYVVDATCGVTVRCQSPHQYARDLADAVRSIVTSPDRLTALSMGARQRVAQIGLWADKAARVSELYDSVVHRRSGPCCLNRT